MKTVNFLNTECLVELGQYGNGRPALRLWVLEDGKKVEPMCTASVNLPAERIEPGQIFIKDYSENTGILDVLTKAGIVTPTGDEARSGHVVIPLCSLNMEAL